jgi:hypothetical protein
MKKFGIFILIASGLYGVLWILKELNKLPSSDLGFVARTVNDCIGYGCTEHGHCDNQMHFPYRLKEPCTAEDRP